MILPVAPRRVVGPAAVLLFAASLALGPASAQDAPPADPDAPRPAPAAAADDADDEPTPAAVGDEPAASDGNGDGDALAAAHQRLRRAEEELLPLTLAAMELVRAERWDDLGALLDDGAPRARVAVLSALRNAGSSALLPRVLTLAAPPAADEVRRAAGDHLDGLAIASEGVFDELLVLLGTGALPAAQHERVLLALGRSRRLAAVDVLVAALEGDHAAAALQALTRLTGQPAGARGADPEAWAAWWENNRWQSREQLLEAALAEERRAAAAALAEREERIVQLELRHMGQDVSRLVEALDADRPAVRLEAAQRLGRHANAEQAASALPLILARLGHPARAPTTNGNGNGGNGGGNGNGNDHAGEAGEPHAAEPVDHADVEPDPEVRRALVAALGVLGRDRPEVRAALLAELRSDDLGTAAEAVGALARVRQEPGVVLPLLDLLEREGLDPAVQVTALTVISQNRPLGVTPRLAPWTDREHPAAVRAAGVRALLAGADPGAVLGQVEELVGGERSEDVRYAVAMGLGEQLRRLGRNGPDDAAAARVEIVQVLGRLLDDVDPSVRAEAASSLGESGELAALGLLESRSRAEADASVMTRILDAFGGLGVIDAVDTIGRVGASWNGADRAELEAAARRALQRIGDDARAADWLGMARTLQQVGAFPLAAWTLRECLHRFEADPAVREVVVQARGELANVLWQSGQAEEAHALLVELHEAGAPHPIATTRLDLLARTSEQLGYFDQAAKYYAERLEVLGAGDSTRDENRRSLVRTLLQAGRAEEALPLVRELLAEDGADNTLLESLARAQAGAGEADAARESYQRLLERLPAEDAPARERVRAALERLAEPAPAEDTAPPAETDGAPARDDESTPA